MRRVLLVLLLLTFAPGVAWGQWPRPKPRDTRLWDQMQQQGLEAGREQEQQWRQQEADRLQQFRDFERERREDRRFRQLRDAIEERER